MATVSSLGFIPGVGEHVLGPPAPHPTINWGNYCKVSCSCGYEIDFKITQAGRGDARSLRTWREHLDGVGAEDALIPVGVIHKKRVTWEIFAMPRIYSGARAFTKDDAWVKGDPEWWLGYPWATVISKSTGVKQLYNHSPSKMRAIETGRKILVHAENRNEKVVYAADAKMEAPELAPVLTLTKFLDEVDEALVSKKLGPAQHTLEALDAFLESVPILQAKRGQLAEHVMERMTLGLDLSDDREEQEEEAPVQTGA